MHSSYWFPGGFSDGIAINRFVNSSIADSEIRSLNRALSSIAAATSTSSYNQKP